MRYLIIILLLVFSIGCKSQQPNEFEQQSQKLSVRPHVEQALREFQENRGGDNEAQFELLHAFCLRRQLMAPRDRNPELADPILDTSSVVTLLGQPDSKTNSDSWIYYFNPEQDWHFELSFRDGQLLYTNFRQLMSAEELATNKKPEATL